MSCLAQWNRCFKIGVFLRQRIQIGDKPRKLAVAARFIICGILKQQPQVGFSCPTAAGAGENLDKIRLIVDILNQGADSADRAFSAQLIQQPDKRRSLFRVSGIPSASRSKAR